MRLSLEKTVRYLRKRLNTPNDQETIYLILAMLECGIDNTPYFYGMNDEELLTAILSILLSRIQEWTMNQLKMFSFDESSMIDFILATPLFAMINKNDFNFIYEDLKKGVLTYEFKRFDTVGR